MTNPTDHHIDAGGAPMTDQTTARDRAWQRLAAAVENASGPAGYATVAVVDLEEALRALAGVPTADVAEVRTEWGVRWPGDDEIEQRASAFGQLADGGESYARRVARSYRADGAEVVRREVRYGAWAAASTAAPEGVDAADEQWCNCQDVSTWHPLGSTQWCPAVEPDGMDLEAQGEMAAELTAAQAAIQQLQTELAAAEKATEGHEDAIEAVRGLVSFAEADNLDTLTTQAVRRALDGDTTKEQR